MDEAGCVRWGVSLVLVLDLLAAPVLAAPGDVDARRGVALAKKGECADALPLLEEAEGRRHSPEVAVALAGCYEMAAELVQASVLYGVVAEEPPSRSHTSADRAAIALAARKVRDVEARIPTLAFAIPEGYEGVTITIDGELVENPKEPQKVDPGDELVVVMKAKGRKERKETITLEEREHRVVDLELAPLSDKPGPKAAATRFWLGASYRGFVIPRFAWGIFGDGGRGVVAPGGAASFVRATDHFDLRVTLGYASFAAPATPFKPTGTPDTEYELVASNLQSLAASVEVTWKMPLDRRQRFFFHVGAGVGVGWTFLGDLYRVQAYPQGFVPGDPYTYLPCAGPNDPGGSYRYCNALDKDATHYDLYTEPSWFSGGVRPLVYPWLALPIVGLSFHPTPRVAIDLEIAPSASGLLTELGARFSL